MKRPGADAQVRCRAEPEQRLARARKDRVTPDEQQAIERHLATRGVTRVPQGQQALDATVPRTLAVVRAEGERKSLRDQKFAQARAQAGAIERAACDPRPLAAPAPAPKAPSARGLAAQPPAPERRPSPAPAAPWPGDSGLDDLPAFRVESARPRFIQAWDAACRFEMVAITSLRIRTGAYQRALGRNSARRVRRLAEGFDWARFGALVVRACPGGFEVVDGQHRAAAARARGIRKVPAIVVEGAGAGVFLGLNRDRAALDAAQLYHAELVAGDGEAALLGAILDRVGLDVPRTATQKAPGPMQTRAVAALRLELRARGAGLLESGLMVMAAAWPHVHGAFSKETLRGCLRAAAELVLAAQDAPGPEMARLADTLKSFDPAALRASARSAAAKHGGAAHAHLARLVCNRHAELGGVSVAVGV
jgi:hypothetical protein